MHYAHIILSLDPNPTLSLHYTYVYHDIVSIKYVTVKSKLIFVYFKCNNFIQFFFLQNSPHTNWRAQMLQSYFFFITYVYNKQLWENVITVFVCTKSDSIFHVDRYICLFFQLLESQLLQLDYQREKQITKNKKLAPQSFHFFI